MLKFLPLLLLTTVIFMQSIPAYCGVTRTASFQVSVTIPEHVMLNSSGTPLSNSPYQLIQTQIVMRNNKNTNLTSIVVP